MPKIIESDTYC